MSSPDADPSYHCLDPETIPATEDHPCDRRSISDAAGLSVLASAVYELAPGEQLPRTYHYHEQREELFYVRSGTLHVETPAETFELEADEVFVAKPNSPHRPYNPPGADDSVVVLGVGSPRSDVALAYEPAEDPE